MRADIIDFTASREQEMFDLLRDMVLIQSGTYNKAGNDRVISLILETTGSDPLRHQLFQQQDMGNHLLLSTSAVDMYEKQILITGHTDTVFPQDTDFRHYKEDEKLAYGPGVIDMKGGLVTGIYALKALDSMGMLDQIPIVFIFNSDEEIGSPTSREIIAREADKSAFAFVLEAGGTDGGIVTERKGKLGFSLKVTGASGHAAFAGNDKPSAILALARKVVALEALNDLKLGVSVNVGTIRGGISPNTVADSAVAAVDVRYGADTDIDRLMDSVQEIAADATVPGTCGQIDWTPARPPMVQTGNNTALYLAAERQARFLGIDVAPECRGGVSDANLIAAKGVPVIDGLGPIGAKDHSNEEYMIKETLKERTQLFTLLLLETWNLYRHGQLFERTGGHS